jgi:protein disulfide-isomerase-like protein
MQSLLPLILLALTVATASSSVLEVTTSTFASLPPNTLLKFYAPWCGHCKRFASTYEAIATALEETETTVARVDGSSEIAISSIFGLQGFPTIYYIAPDGATVYQYKGARSKEALVAFTQGGYQDAEAMNYLTGPYGIAGQAKWCIVYVGVLILGLHNFLSTTALGAVGSGVVITVGGVLCTAGFVIALTVFTDVRRTKGKRD